MITGPIIPTQYVSEQNPAPEPDAEFVQASNGQVFTCTRTGRMWMLGRTNSVGEATYGFYQVLPHVRSDDGAYAVKAVNDNGDLRIQTGLGASGNPAVNSRVQIDSNVIVNTDTVQLPGTPEFPVFAESGKGGSVTKLADTGTVWAVLPQTVPLASDFTLTNANQAYRPAFFSTLQQGPIGVNTLLRYSISATAYHNNQYELSVCISRWRAGNVKQEPISATTVTSQTGGYVHCELTADVSLGFDEDGQDYVSAYFAASVAGVVLKAAPTFTFPDSRPISIVPPATYIVTQRLS